MSEYFILPRVSTHLLLRERVKVPDHLRHLSDGSPQLQVLAIWVFSWALYFLSEKLVESCVRASGFFGWTHLLMDLSPGTCDDSRFDLFSVFTLTVSAPWAVTARKFLAAIEGCEGDFGRRWLAVF